MTRTTSGSSRWSRCVGRKDDSGLSLVELLVAMGIFTVVISVFTAALVTMTQGTAHTQSVADAGDAARKAFQRMDKQVRYAAAINRPGAGTSGARYVEFRTAAVPAGTSPFCTQWKLDPVAQTLEVRTWADVPGATQSGWNTIVTEVRNDLAAGEEPFAFAQADADVLHQTLHVVLRVGRGSTAGADVSTTFVARNSSADVLSNLDTDGDGQSDTPVCTSASGRP